MPAIVKIQHNVQLMSWDDNTKLFVFWLDKQIGNIISDANEQKQRGRMDMSMIGRK